MKLTFIDMISPFPNLKALNNKFITLTELLCYTFV